MFLVGELLQAVIEVDGTDGPLMRSDGGKMRVTTHFELNLRNARVNPTHRDATLNNLARRA